MPTRLEEKKAKLIGRIVTEARKKLSRAKVAALEPFIAQYYGNVPPQDILDQTPATLFGAALAHWTFGAQRRPGRASVRAFNPTQKADGWTAQHTVIEVVNDDMPFLVDSVSAELNRRDLTVHLAIHPIFRTRRDKTGKLLQVLEAGNSAPGMNTESFMHLHVTGQPSDRLGDIQSGIQKVLRDVRFAVEDWRAMRDRMRDIIEELESRPANVSVEEATEVRDFLRWIHDNHFTFLGFREYAFKGSSAMATVPVDGKAGLGVLSDAKVAVFDEYHNLAAMPPDVRAFIRRPDLLMVTKSSRLATVHRSVHMDSIGVKRLDRKGRVVGERIFVGLFTSSAYNRSPRDIPLLRRKLQKTFDRAGFTSSSHDGKALLNIIETYPRDELFQVSDDTLLHTALGVLHLQDRQRVALFIRRDDFERFISCLVYIPRDRYNTDLRKRMQAILEESFDGKVQAFNTQLGNSPLARLHVILRTTPGGIPDYVADAVEARLVAASRLWTDYLQEALVEAHGEDAGLTILRRYQDAFSSSYRERFDARAAVGDIAKVDAALDCGAVGMNLYRPPDAAHDALRFRIFHPDRPIPLSDILPMLEHMGLRVVEENPHTVKPADCQGRKVMIHDFGLEVPGGADVDVDTASADFHDAFARVWQGDMESDGFNGLVLNAGLGWRQVVLLRAFCKYLRQAGITYSQTYMEQTLINNAAITCQIVELFTTLFDPAATSGGAGRAARIRRKLNAGLNAVVSADEDRILRRFINLVDSMVRTNYFQTDADGGHKPYVAFKLDCEKIEELPLPRPFREIFVHSPRVDGLHLRFGRVARGGMRWSDRPEDFRTEILGLVKAQQVKNAVIVPVGSKGGFVVKRPPPPGDREAFQAEGIACYKTLISGMLDITDNLKGDKVVPPESVVRLDGDDPYLVVAADKGTATFSDIANGISAEYGHWLGDAFASGGSQGYDHKGMGITARGAWESVKRHFRENGTDIQKEDFTVVGCGDMSGDVFGNGMLLSRHICLVGAFNHLHIFVDPDPDPAKSFTERKRMFKLPRSSWSDFNTDILSKGGAVFERKAKSLTLSAEVRKCFGITKEKVTPNELIHAMLVAEIDLLWFGGIGTYVKAASESHLDAGDRANDANRVDGAELRARVIGEGANLGMTQLGRVEYALRGGRLNTDSIDNSAGVDCSDHEVNIKILIDKVVADGGLTEKQRNALLARMTDEVAALVLRHNYLQSQAITMIQTRGTTVLDDQIRLMRRLERDGRLNRAVEFLPDDEELGERATAKTGLTRPELAILMPYSKIWLYDELLQSDVPDDAYLASDLVQYFPTPLHDKYAAYIASHRLRREIIATRLTNSMINRVGGTFVGEFMEKTGMAAADIARAYAITRQVFRLREVWEAIEVLDNKVPAAAQTAMLLEVNHLIEWVTLWFLRNGAQPLSIGAHIEEFEDGMKTLADGLMSALPAHYRDDVATRAKPHMDQGVPEALALRIASLVNLYSGCDIVRLAARRKIPVVNLARLYFAVGTRFRLGRLRAAADRLDSDSHWQKLAVAALIEEVYGHQLNLASQVLDAGGSRADPKKAIRAWESKNRAAVDQTEQLLSELWASGVTDLSMVAVASRQFRALLDAPLK